VKKFSQMLKRIRRKKGLSQNKLAKLTGLSSSAISQYESNIREPSYSALIKIIIALQCLPSDLLDLKGAEREALVRRLNPGNPDSTVDNEAFMMRLEVKN
jgi:transcriptional regulator with XRE-family HTH domain